MELNKIKKLIEDVIEDLTNAEPLNKILLKVQVIAYNLKNEKFKEWIENEVNGKYLAKEELPEYRISNCEVFSDISNQRGIMKNFKIPTEMFSNSDATELARTVLFYEPICEISQFGDTHKDLKKFLPNVFFQFINNLLNPGWKTISAWQVISNITCKNIVETFKSKLLQFFLELNEEMEINVDFDVITNKIKINRIMNTTINAGVVTTGKNSAITVSNSNIVSGENNTVSISKTTRKEIEEILKQIEDSINIFSESQDEVQSEISRIKIQLSKENPKTGIVKNSFEFLKKLFMEVVATGTAPLVLEGINKAIELC